MAKEKANPQAEEQKKVNKPVIEDGVSGEQLDAVVAALKKADEAIAVVINEGNIIDVAMLGMALRSFHQNHMSKICLIMERDIALRKKEDAKKEAAKAAAENKNKE